MDESSTSYTARTECATESIRRLMSVSHTRTHFLVLGSFFENKKLGGRRRQIQPQMLNITNDLNDFHEMLVKKMKIWYFLLAIVGSHGVKDMRN